MGQILVLKNADFSENAVSLDNVYEVVKETDVPSLSYPMTTGYTNRRFNTIPFQDTVKIYAVGFTLPSDVSEFTYDEESENTNNIAIGSCSISTVGSITTVTEGTRIVTSVNSLIKKVVDSTDEETGYSPLAGTTHIIHIAEPLTINAGDYLVFYISGNRFAVYSRNVNGEHGYMIPVSNPTSTSTGNFAITLYGVVVSSGEE